MKSKVLVVEDYEDTREFMKFLLQDYGFDVAEATNGYEALESVKRQVPDLILMDISMPGMDGLTATRQIHERLPHTRVILLTNYGDPDLARHALDVGASGFVLKVYASTELVQAIRMVLGGGTYVSSAIAI